ncbi:MAG: glycosyltransferase family 4 protein [Jhaorihella sp.]
MIRVAFHAPMKSPLSPVPSGDREMARNLMAAIAAGGARVDLVSGLKTHDKAGDVGVQSRTRELAKAEITRLTGALAADPPALWVTYHNYYKAPDLIGPAVSRALGLPYVQVESTRARKRLSGRWADFAAAAEAACDAAAAIFHLTANDLIALKRHRPQGQSLIRLRPFLPIAQLPDASDCSGAMLAAGMMRDGDKLDSYRIVADTLAQLEGAWRLDIAGDGPARGEVEAMMAPFGPRVRFLGQLDRTALAAAYGRASLFFWPGVNEAFGMVYLEAQAAGLPVVAQNRPGVRDILLPGDYPGPREGPGALASRIRTLLDNPGLRRDLGASARAMIARRHLTAGATETFWSAVTPFLETAP